MTVIDDHTMNSMNFLVWMLPVIFMIHDFEEIIMAEVWGKRFRERIALEFPKRRPFGLADNHKWLTPTFSIAVAIEFFLFSAVSLLSAIFQNYFFWFAAFLGLIIHMFFIHILACVPFKGYVPGAATSLILLWPGIWTLVRACDLLKIHSAFLIPAGILGIVLLAALLPALHRFMKVTDHWLDAYSEKSG